MSHPNRRYLKQKPKCYRIGEQVKIRKDGTRSYISVLMRCNRSWKEDMKHFFTNQYQVVNIPPPTITELPAGQFIVGDTITINVTKENHRC